MAPNSTAMSALLGDKLMKGVESQATDEELATADVVGLYFSAHWCGPCRGFTPKLVEAYNKLRHAGKKLEVVFVSSDSDEAAFAEYYKEMPWLALPYADRKAKDALSKKYKVRGIPTLVFVDRATGATISKDGRSLVMEDPEGVDFPWAPKTTAELLGNEFVKPKDGGTVAASTLADKYIGLYFSAHWCGPCRGFTPTLTKVYQAMKDKGIDNFEIVFVSSDSDEAAFNEYHGEMPWLALPYADRKAKNALSNLFEVSGIPTLVILGPGADRPVINVDGRMEIGDNVDETVARFPWHPPLVPALENASFINDSPTVVVLAEGMPEGGAKGVRAAVEAAAQAQKGSGKDEPRFTMADPDDGLARRMRTLTKLGSAGAEAEVVLVDLPDDQVFYKLTAGATVTEDTLTKFVADFRDGKLKDVAHKLNF